MTLARMPRAVLPGDDGARPDLYDAETHEYIGTAASPDVARWLCATLWRETRTRALPQGETAVAPDICAKLDALLVEPTRPELHADPFTGAREYLAGDGADGRSTGTVLLRRIMQALDEPTATQPSEPCDTASVQEVGVATSPRDPSPIELVDQLTWECRRLAEAQYDVGTTLGRLRSSVARSE